MNEFSVPGIDEQYTSALSTSNPRVHLDKRTSADVLIASGMSNSRTGAAHDVCVVAI